MLFNQALRITLLWLVASLVLLQCFYAFSESHLRQSLHTKLQQHLNVALDESYFDRSADRANDVTALQRIGTNMNAAFADIIVSRWYAAYGGCDVTVHSIDGVQIEGARSAATISIFLPRKQLEREVVVGYSCQPRYGMILLLLALLGLMFWLLYRQLPEPMSRSHRHWMNYLLAQGYGGDHAFETLREFSAAQLSFTAEGEQLLQQLHNIEQDNFGQLVLLCNDPRVARLDEQQMQWLQLGLQLLDGNHEAAILLALAEDSLVIDLRAMSLRVRGLPLAMAGTPLFYYAWYALHRKEGEGWIRNPASNRPDLAKGAELAALMEEYGGHGKAINDLEAGGLKARTLDQNRSRIKEEIVGVLGENLATNYLFEGARERDSVPMRYRLMLASDKIQVLT